MASNFTTFPHSSEQVIGESGFWGKNKARNGNWGAWKYGEVSDSPLYIGYRNGSQVIKAGWNGHGVQDAFQNFIHRYIMKQNYYNQYSDYKGLYFQVANQNPFSIYDY